MLKSSHRWPVCQLCYSVSVIAYKAHNMYIDWRTNNCPWNIQRNCHCPLMDRSCSCPCSESVRPGENVKADWVRDCVNGKVFAGSVRPQCCWCSDVSFWSRCNCVTICCNWSFSSPFSCITLSWSWQHSRHPLASFYVMLDISLLAHCPGVSLPDSYCK